MADSWKTVLEELDVDVEPVDAPDDHLGTWFATITAFATRGFMRVLASEVDDGLLLHAQLAPPDGGSATVEELARSLQSVSGGEWEVSSEAEPPWTLDGVVSLEDVQAVGATFAAFTRLSRALGDDDAAAFRKTLDELGKGSEETADSEPEDDQDAAVSEPAEAAEEAPSGGAFEKIGGPEPADESFENFDFDARVAGDDVHLGIALGTHPSARDLDAFADTIERNLHAKFDVDVHDLAPPDSEARPGGTGAVLHFLLEPTSLEGDPLPPDEVIGVVGDYLATVRDLAHDGVDPFVFLGIHASTRKKGASKASSNGHEVELFVEEEPDATAAAPSGDRASSGVTLDLERKPSEHDPLEAGNFEDPRLDRVDATTQLVDVVLRHPGFSDRNIGQVLSILLSIDYAAAREIAAEAPTVLAWGVSRDRGQTIKTVVDGAGGKILLVEPGTFGQR